MVQLEFDGKLKVPSDLMPDYEEPVQFKVPLPGVPDEVATGDWQPFEQRLTTLKLTVKKFFVKVPLLKAPVDLVGQIRFLKA